MGGLTIESNFAAYDQNAFLRHSAEEAQESISRLVEDTAVLSLAFTSDMDAAFYLPRSVFLLEGEAQQGVLFIRDCLISNRMIKDMRKAQRSALQVLTETRIAPDRPHDGKTRVD